MRDNYVRLLAICGLLLAGGAAATAQAGNIVWGGVIEAYGIAKVYAEEEEDLDWDEDGLFGLGLIDIEAAVSGASARAGASLDSRSVTVGALAETGEAVEGFAAAGAYAEGGVIGSFGVDADGMAWLPAYLAGSFATPGYDRFEWDGSAYAAGAATFAIYDGDFNALYFSTDEWDEEDGSFLMDTAFGFDLLADETYYYMLQAKTVTEISREGNLALTNDDSFASFAGLSLGVGEPPVSPVPEPTTMALFGAGLAAALLVARRRGRNAR